MKCSFIYLTFAICFSYPNFIQAQTSNYSITPSSVWIFEKGITIGEVLSIYPSDLIKKKIGTDEFGEPYYDDYEIYDSTNTHLLTLTPKRQNRMSSNIDRVMIVDNRFRTNDGVGMNSTYADLLKFSTVNDYQPDMNHIVLVVDSLNSSFSISKKGLDPGWWDEKKEDIDPSKIPTHSKLVDVVVWWKN